MRLPEIDKHLIFVKDKERFIECLTKWIVFLDNLIKRILAKFSFRFFFSLYVLTWYNVYSSHFHVSKVYWKSYLQWPSVHLYWILPCHWVREWFSIAYSSMFFQFRPWPTTTTKNTTTTTTTTSSTTTTSTTSTRIRWFIQARIYCWSISIWFWRTIWISCWIHLNTLHEWK